MNGNDAPVPEDERNFGRESPPSEDPLVALLIPARSPNLSRKFIRDCEAKLGLRFVPEATGEPDSFSPEDVFHYIYAIFHSPLYRYFDAPDP